MLTSADAGRRRDRTAPTAAAPSPSRPRWSSASLLMAFSSNAGVREVQNGVGFAFRPIQARSTGVGRRRSRRSVASIAEIDRLRVDNGALRSGERAADRRERPAARRSQRENEQLTGLLAAAQRASTTRPPRPRVIARESSEFRRVIGIDKGTNAGIKEGDVVDRGRRRPGRTGDRASGRTAPSIVLLTDRASTVIGQLDSNAATGRGHRPARRRARHAADRREREGLELGDEVVTAGIELGGGVRSPYPKGLLIGQVVDVRRDANAVVQTAYLQPAADLDKLEYVLVVLDYQGGLPPVDEQPVDCSGDNAAGRCPRASSRALAVARPRRARAERRRPRRARGPAVHPRCYPSAP